MPHGAEPLWPWGDPDGNWGDDDPTVPPDPQEPPYPD